MAKTATVTLSAAEIQALPRNRYLRKLALYNHLSKAGMPAGVGEDLVEYGIVDVSANEFGDVTVRWKET